MCIPSTIKYWHKDLSCLHALSVSGLACLIESSRDAESTQIIALAMRFKFESHALIKKAMSGSLGMEERRLIYERTCPFFLEAPLLLPVYILPREVYGVVWEGKVDVTNLWYAVVGVALAAGNRQVGLCANCGGVFLKTNPRQRYCDDECAGSARRAYLRRVMSKKRMK